MPKADVLILNAGGLRSLTATSLANAEKSNFAFLYINDGRPSHKASQAMMEKQAEYYGVQHTEIIDLPFLYQVKTREIESQVLLTRSTYAISFILMTALQVATDLSATRIIWPITIGSDFKSMARVSETEELINHMQLIWGAKQISLELPFIEMSLGQVIEVGQQLNTPWSYSRSCKSAQAIPDGTSSWTVERREAFREAGIPDPLVNHPNPAVLED